MSEWEHLKGVAKLVKFEDGENIEAFCKRYLEECGRGKREYHDSYKEAFEDEYCYEFVVVDDEIYDVRAVVEYEDNSDISKAERNDDGSIDIELKFYNGGIPFRAAFADAIRELKSKSESGVA